MFQKLAAHSKHKHKSIQPLSVNKQLYTDQSEIQGAIRLHQQRNPVLHA